MWDPLSVGSQERPKGLGAKSFVWQSGARTLVVRSPLAKTRNVECHLSDGEGAGAVA